MIAKYKLNKLTFIKKNNPICTVVKALYVFENQFLQ